MCFGSFSNSDAWGMFHSKYANKNPRAFKPSRKDIKSIELDSWIVGHNRYATTGMCEYALTANDSMLDSKPHPNKDNHPFILNDLILVHNGIISNSESLREQFKIVSDIRTDSFVILWLIDYYLKAFMTQGLERKASLIAAIQKTTTLISGTYSIFLYDNFLDILVYLKESSTQFMFQKKGNGLLVGSTDYSNLDYSYFDEKEGKIVFPDSNRIYEITSDFSNPLKMLAKFKEKPFFKRSKPEIDLVSEAALNQIDEDLKKSIS